MQDITVIIIAKHLWASHVTSEGMNGLVMMLPKISNMNYVQMMISIFTAFVWSQFVEVDWDPSWPSKIPGVEDHIVILYSAWHVEHSMITWLNIALATEDWALCQNKERKFTYPYHDSFYKLECKAKCVKLTHCCLVTSYGNIDLGQHCLNFRNDKST